MALPKVPKDSSVTTKTGRAVAKTAKDSRYAVIVFQQVNVRDRPLRGSIYQSERRYLYGQNDYDGFNDYGEEIVGEEQQM